MATGSVSQAAVSDMMAELAALEDPKVRAVAKRQGTQHDLAGQL